MSGFAGMTYQAAVDVIAKETVEAVEQMMDGEWNFKDFQETLEAGQAWNAAMKIPGLDKATLLPHVFAKLSQYGVALWKPLPEGTIPEA